MDRIDRKFVKRQPLNFKSNNQGTESGVGRGGSSKGTNKPAPEPEDKPIKISKPVKLDSEKAKKISNFNPNDPGFDDSGIFGLPFTIEEADIALVPVPWEVTVSYGSGTGQGPSSILAASRQVDLNDSEFPSLWRLGIAMAEEAKDIRKDGVELKKKVGKYLKDLSAGKAPNTKESKSIIDQVNKGSKELEDWVKNTTTKLLKAGKLVGLVGGDHSVPLGFIKALAQEHDRFGVLQIDAHMDLRKDFEGFEQSHASIMRNVAEIKEVAKLVQVGIRDFCESESSYAVENRNKIITFTDSQIRHRQFEGDSWQVIAERLINDLPKKVYISFDIDGLDPQLCPNTGTPVPGGLQFQEVMYIFKTLIKSGREIIGFDLCEVSQGGTTSDWDANVGARVLFKLCGYLAQSNGKV